MNNTSIKTSDIDYYIGQRLRTRRTLLGMSQEDLAQHLDLTFQQIQKYENGKNRIAAGRLYKISKFLSVSVDFFFHGIDGEENYMAAFKMHIDGNILHHPETVELIKQYYKINDQEKRKAVVHLIKSFTQKL